jgi:hypothetical protein
MASSSLSDVGLGFAEYMTELGKLPDACLDLLSQDFSSGLALQSDSKLVFGYRIIAINDGSPVAKAASKEPIQPYEDLIVGLNGKPLDATKCKPNAGPLHSTVKDHEDKELTLTGSRVGIAYVRLTSLDSQYSTVIPSALGKSK